MFLGYPAGAAFCALRSLYPLGELLASAISVALFIGPIGAVSVFKTVYIDKRYLMRSSQTTRFARSQRSISATGYRIAFENFAYAGPNRNDRQFASVSTVTLPRQRAHSSAGVRNKTGDWSGQADSDGDGVDSNLKSAVADLGS